MLNAAPEESSLLSAVQMISINNKVLASYDEILFDEIVDIKALNKAFYLLKSLYPVLRSKFNISLFNKTNPAFLIKLTEKQKDLHSLKSFLISSKKVVFE